MNSFASSASLVDVRTVFVTRWRNRSVARSAARSSSAPMICGSVCSSSRAWPSAIRSGQNATSTEQPRRAEPLGHVRGRARIDRAAQDHQRSIAEVRRDLVDGPLEHRHRRPEELVDGSADDHDERLGPLDHRPARTELQAPGREHAPKQLIGARLEERHLAGRDPIERRLVGVVDADAEPGIRERQAQREADMAASAEDDDIEGLVRHGEKSSRRGARGHRTDGPSQSQIRGPRDHAMPAVSAQATGRSESSPAASFRPSTPIRSADFAGH